MRKTLRTLTTRMPSPLYAELEALAEREDRLLADVVRRVLAHGLATWGQAATSRTSRT